NAPLMVLEPRQEKVVKSEGKSDNAPLMVLEPEQRKYTISLAKSSVLTAAVAALFELVHPSVESLPHPSILPLWKISRLLVDDGTFR
ncbi:hypothetical protein SMA90_33195, partial [Escherichia coli]